MATKALATPNGPAPLKKADRPAITLEYVEALRAYSDVLFKGGLCPTGQGTSRPETVAAIIETGKDVGLSPTQALASIMIVNGRPLIYGDAGLALIRASGLLDDIDEHFEGEPGTDGYAAVCTVKRAGAQRARTVKFTVAEAKRANLWMKKKGPWTEYPERMLMWRARSWATRDEFGDVLRGLMFVEEGRDIAPELPADAPRVAVPVQIVTPPALNTADLTPQPSPPQLPAATVETSDPPTAADSGRPEADEAATREQLLERLVELRGSLLVAHGHTDTKTDAARAEWAKALAPYGVATAKELSDDKLRELVAELAKTHDPF